MEVKVIKLLLILLRQRNTNHMFLHRPCGNAQALTLSEQEELLAEFHQTSAGNFKGPVDAVEHRPSFLGDNPLLTPAWSVIALAL